MTLLDREPTHRREPTNLWDAVRPVGFNSADPSYLSPSEGEDERWGRQIDRLLDIRRLRENWDGEGASAVNPLTVDSALELLRSHRDRRSLPPPSRIGAAGDGTIVIEWQITGNLWSLEISEPGKGDWMFVPAGGHASHWREQWGVARRPAGVVWS